MYKVFKMVIKNNPTVISLLFVDDLGFMVSETSIQKISKMLESVTLAVF